MDAVLLWERARDAVRARRGHSWRLDDPAVAADLQRAVDALHLSFLG